MQIRNYSLPAGWFPRDSASVSSFLSDFKKLNRGSDDLTAGERSCRAAISPHAGWYYSGRIAARAAASLCSEAQTIVVIGGHLPAGSPPLFAMEDAVKTPFGSMVIDDKLRSVLFKELNGKDDRYRDNTVEVLLPMAHYFFPEAELIWLRLASDEKSFEAGKIISQAAETINRRVDILASTDLTHYGPNYGFTPKGKGAAALKWIQEVNDAAFIKAVESGDCAQALRCAEEDCSSCSAGAVLGAMGFAAAQNLGNARLLQYATSADADECAAIPDSFVGYAAFAWNSDKM